MYNLLSDRLDTFEKSIRRRRNQVLGRLTSWAFGLAHWSFRRSRAYIHTDLLKRFKEKLSEILIEVDMELELRRKINASGIEQIIRDSTVLTGEQLRATTAAPKVRQPHSRPESRQTTQPMDLSQVAAAKRVAHVKKASITSKLGVSAAPKRATMAGGLTQRAALGRTMQLDHSSDLLDLNDVHLTEQTHQDEYFDMNQLENSDEDEIVHAGHNTTLTYIPSVEKSTFDLNQQAVIAGGKKGRVTARGQTKKDL